MELSDDCLTHIIKCFIGGLHMNRLVQVNHSFHRLCLPLLTKCNICRLYYDSKLTSLTLVPNEKRWMCCIKCLGQYAWQCDSCGAFDTSCRAGGFTDVGRVHIPGRCLPINCVRCDEIVDTYDCYQTEDGRTVCQGCNIDNLSLRGNQSVKKYENFEMLTAPRRCLFGVECSVCGIHLINKYLNFGGYRERFGILNFCVHCMGDVSRDMHFDLPDERLNIGVINSFDWERYSRDGKLHPHTVEFPRKRIIKKAILL